MAFTNSSSQRLSRRAALLAGAQLGFTVIALSACGASGTAAQTSSSAASGAPKATTSTSSSAAAATSSSKAATSSSAAVAAPGAKSSLLQVWEPGWGAQSPIDKGYTASLDALAAKNPSVKAELVTAPFPQKFLTAAAAGTPPDLVFIPPEGGWPQDWANKQLIKNLDADIHAAKLSASNFFKPAWEGSLFKGSQYVLPIEVDPNFPLVSNKSLLQQVGIDKPPATINELDAANQKLFQKTGAAVKRLGIFPPWMTYGPANSLTTYFAVFGGGWLDPKDPSKLLMTQPGNVAALTWMKQYADNFGGYDVIQKFSGTWGKNGYTGAMALGYLAMGPMVSANYTQAVNLAKSSEFAGDLELSVMPVANGVKPDPGWLGGWAMSIPGEAKRADASWTVLQWMGGSPEGTDAWAEINGFLPGYKNSPYFTKHAQDPGVSTYITVLQNAYFVVPSVLGWQEIPGSAYSTLLLNSVQGKTDINTALEQFQTVAQGVLDKYKGAS
ncbi:MAG: extracellular solute-binding protein [Chloroflexi bacterium]|nr:extracellular solute-binding protein [Chloroflexota bacterium]